MRQMPFKGDPIDVEFVTEIAYAPEMSGWVFDAYLQADGMQPTPRLRWMIVYEDEQSAKRASDALPKTPEGQRFVNSVLRAGGYLAPAYPDVELSAA